MKKINFISNLRNLYKIQLQKFMIPNQHKKALWLQIYIKKKIKRHRRSSLKLAVRHILKNQRSESALRRCNTIWIWRALSPHSVARLRWRGDGHMERSFSNWCQRRRSFWIPTAPLTVTYKSDENADVRIIAPPHHRSCGWTSETCFAATMGTAMSAPRLNVEVFPRRIIDVGQLKWRDGGHLNSERGARRRDREGKKKKKNKPEASLKRLGKKKKKRKKKNKYSQLI